MAQHVSALATPPVTGPRTKGLSAGPWSRLAWPVVAAVALHAGMMALYAAAFGGEVSAFVCAGREDLGRPPYEIIRVGFPSGGYDGKLYYAIARSPWSMHDWGGFDDPAKRQIRILYPAIGWLLSAGNPYLLLWILPAINLAVIAAMALLGAQLAVRHGLSPWWGFILPLAVNAGLPALRDLTDPLSTLCVFGLLAGWLLGWRGWALALWAAAALFTREQNLAVVLILLGAAVWARRPRTAAGLTAVIAVWLVWIGVLWFSYGRSPLMTGHGAFAWPLAGMISRWTHLFGASGSRASALQNFLALSHLAVQILLGLVLIPLRADWTAKAVLLAGAGLAVMGGASIYADIFGFTRVFSLLPLGVWVASVQAQKRWPIWLLTPAVAWPCAAILRAWQGY